ncbi:copper amine oxidase N-terminal domain-containing protein [Paenibacillus hunanensis]|uniref:copper amine oxidase N-terminal domain-containing protein n=1 Tax=Paenibacillus hunanensis TaxID=539262 RepID=UPI0020273C4D|nr:copper amine oxidase N-terminal domain-containing protein [Paenibacillus hunanensis]MCL9660752.1 copper amine oxidase N-terminal domain-containing protein [Paenibacillus hunanensis]
MIRKMVISSVLLVALLVTSHAANARAIYTINVEVNGNPISLASGNTDSSPYIEQETGTAYVPLRFVSQNLGGIVSWDRSKQQVTIVSNKGVVTTLTIGSTTAYVNKQPKVLSDAPVLLNYPNRVIVPLRFVSEVLGATVDAKKADDGFLNVNITMSK